MSYLRCPNCGITVFDRNPLDPTKDCPRCARRGIEVPLERQPRGGAAAASLLRQPETTKGGAPGPGAA